MSDLNTAIQLVRQGQLTQAQKMLETIVRTETGNVPAWLWYAQTFPTTETRLKVLSACLKLNPGNQQVTQAIQMLQAKLTAPANPPTAAPARQETYARPPEKPVELPPAYARILAEKPQPVQPNSAHNWGKLDQAPAPAVPIAPPQRQPAETKSAFDWDELEKASAPAASVMVSQTFLDYPAPVTETRKPGRSYRFFDVWWIALTDQDVRAYATLLDDPDAGTSRAIEWQIYTSLVICIFSMLVGYFLKSDPASRELWSAASSNSSNPQGVVLLIMAVTTLVTVVSSVVGLLINGAFQNFLAGLFGGTGNFSRTIYALSAYLMPISIIYLFMIRIPVLGICLSVVLGIYALILNVRALQAAHGLNGGRATIVVAIPTLLMLMIVCGLFIYISSLVGTALQN
jgi:hypothetical protein